MSAPPAVGAIAGSVQQDDRKPRRQMSCLGKAITSAIEGGIIGGALGGIMASGSALSLGFSVQALGLIARLSFSSALSFGGFLAAFNGGSCSMERLRGTRDWFNPFVMGGVMGVAGALPGFFRPLPTAPWAYRNPRALAGAGLSSAALCSFFWWFSNGSRELPSPADDVAAKPHPVASPVPARPALIMPPPIDEVAERSELYDSMRGPTVMPEPLMPEPPQNDWESYSSPMPAGTSGNARGKEQLLDPWASAKK